MFYDSEFGSPQAYFDNFGIDRNRVLHTPISSVEQLRHDISVQLEQIERKDKVIIIIDSIGNLASKKETQDALEGKDSADMTRAKVIKSLYRIITPVLKIKDIPLISICHVYQTMELYSKAIISGGCLVAGTELIMADGSLKEIQDITVGEYVKTLQGDKPVTHIWNPETLEEGKPECVRVYFDDGYWVECSVNHPFLVDGNWVQAKELSTNSITTKIDGGKAEVIKIENIGRKEVYDISVQDAEHYVLENGVVTHNTGLIYSADHAWIVGRSQEKDGTDVIGYNFNIRVEKSRFVREQSKVPITVTFEGGLNKWSGLLEMALESGLVVKPSNGWYSLVNPESGEVDAKKVREKDTQSEDFLGVVLKSKAFENWVNKNYKLETPKTEDLTED